MDRDCEGEPIVMEEPQMTDGDCTGCRYAQPTVSKTENLLLECFRYPPTVFFIDDDFVNVFPDAIRRCGEYRKPHEEQVNDLTNLLRKLRKDGEPNAINE